VKRTALVLLACVAVGASIPVVRPFAERAWFFYRLARDPAPAYLPNPVSASGRSRLEDTWGAPRPGRRTHEGVDIFAPKGTPVVSTTRGIVTRVGMNRLGGRVVGVLRPGLEWHYYAHLDRFGAVREGDVIPAGAIIGYVGNTGNASGTPPHLHYGIYRNGAVNPYPRLASPDAGVRSGSEQGQSNDAIRIKGLSRVM